MVKVNITPKCPLCNGSRPLVGYYEIELSHKNGKSKLKICNECASTLDVINTAVHDIDKRDKLK